MLPILLRCVYDYVRVLSCIVACTMYDIRSACTPDDMHTYEYSLYTDLQVKMYIVT